ncbi:MAG: hypothetical protein JNL74_11085 [Fibrobacteres bacterium]|nr:hypothetical protein [Fibrobacterota bacterium]
MPIINRKEKYKNAARMTYLIALAVHVIAFVIIWQFTEVGQKMEDYIVEVVSGKSAAPPPPKKPPVSKVQPVKPTNIIPKFEVKSQTKIDPGFTASFKEFSSISSDGPSYNFTSLAQNYSTKTVSIDVSSAANAMTSILSAFDMGSDLFGSNRKTSVSGAGKRMRARLNLCLVSSPGTTTLGATGRPSGTKVATAAASDQDTLKSSETWEYVFKKYSSFERARSWLRSNTQIQITDNTITMPLDLSFSEWVTNIRKRGAVQMDSSSSYHEAAAIRVLEHAIDKMAKDDIGGKRTYVAYCKKAVYDYLRRKYEIEAPDALTIEKLIEEIGKRNVLRDWRTRGITNAIAAINSLNADWSEDALIAAQKPIYIFFREAQALENPLMIISNILGLDKISEENLEILRTYVKNGGFIWIDDPAVATSNVKDLNDVCRAFISNLMKFDEKSTLSEKDQNTFANLSKEDRRVQGFSMGNPLRQFSHPQVHIPVTVTQNTPATIRVFNRMGIPVKQFVWTRENPMKAGAYTTQERAFVWNCDNNDGEPVESGVYFVQMEAGLFQQTVVAFVSKLRKLDEKHPLMGVVHNFRNVPVCTIESGSTFWKNRPYGNAAFGYYYGSRMVLLYTEGAGVMAGLGDIKNPVGQEQASKFMNNVIAFCLSDEDGVAIRP